MRILIVTVFTAFVCLVSFWMIKFWGRSQGYIEYHHPMYVVSEKPLLFIKPKFENMQQTLEQAENLFLDVAVTSDQKLVIPKKIWTTSEKPIRYSTLAEIQDHVIDVQQMKELLKTKKIIFNLIENAQAVHENFLENMKQIGFEKGQNFIVTSPYEAPIKSLKDIAPALLFGTTQPEILKIVAMNSMGLIEAANIRADVVIHPLYLKKQLFFTDDLMAELKHRYKKIIVGPLSDSEKNQAMELKPYGLIFEK